MSGLALIATELLVGPAVSDGVPALQTMSLFPFIQIVVHTAKLTSFYLLCNTLCAGFSFSYENASFFIIRTGDKKNLTLHKKDSKNIRKRKICITGI